MKLLRKASTIFDGSIDISASFAAVLMAFIMLSVCSEVVMRYFFESPMLWVIEVTEYSLLWLTFLAATWVLRKEGHVVMDLLINRLNPGTRTMVNIITSVAGAAICLVITWYGAKVTVDLFQRGHFFQSILFPPSYILFLIIPIGSLMLIVQFLRRAYGYLIDWRALPRQRT
jgi:TRAP-type C4-dicarboxylate transport system permease small subunit